MMLKSTLKSSSFVAAMLLAGTMIAQPTAGLMSFQDHTGGAISNGSLVEYTDLASVVEMQSDIECAVNGTTPRDINVKRYELNVVANTENYFCWGLCYLAQPAGSIPLWLSTDPIFNMLPNSFGTDFHAYHRPNGEVGCMTYRYVWFDLNNVSDSSWLDIKFCSDPVGVEEISGPVSNFSVYPNPASGDEAMVEVELLTPSNNAVIVLHNVLGEEVLSTKISSNDSQVKLPLNGVDQGVYFVSVQLDGELLRTERLVVR